MVEDKEILLAYPAVFTPEEDGGYLIEFPDVQGAFTGINTDDVAFGIKMAEEALGLVLADYIENNDQLAEPTPINKIKQPQGSFVTLVKTDVAKYLQSDKTVKKTLTIPEWADRKARKQKINFSALLTKAILQETE